MHMTYDRRKFMAGVVASTMWGIAANARTTSGRPGELQQLPAMPSDTLADAIMVNLHLNFRTTIWGQSQSWRSFLVDLGARYFRTYVGNQQEAVDDYLWLYEHGLKGNVRVVQNAVVDGIGPVFDMSLTERNLNVLRDKIGTDKMIGVEGANEPNNPNTATSGWGWRTRDHQKFLYDTANFALRGGVPVVGPSIFRREPDGYTQLGSLSDSVDVTNLHNYNGGRRPSVGTWSQPAVLGKLEDIMAAAKAVAPGKPLWVTEYNYSATANSSLWTSGIIPDTIAAKYLLRGIALQVRNGAQKVSIYRLLDEADETEPYGLITETSPGVFAPRATYHALRRFLGRVGDPGAAFQSKGLAYSLTGDLSNIETMLLQKRDGTWVLLVWQEVDLWNRSMRIEIRPRRRSLTLTLPFPFSLKAYEPSEMSDPTLAVRSTQSVELDVPGHMMMVELKRER